jgi:hypothetical protein
VKPYDSRARIVSWNVLMDLCEHVSFDVRIAKSSRSRIHLHVGPYTEGGTEGALIILPTWPSLRRGDEFNPRVALQPMRIEGDVTLGLDAMRALVHGEAP